MGKSWAAGVVTIIVSALSGLVIVGPPWQDDAPATLRLEGAGEENGATTVPPAEGEATEGEATEGEAVPAEQPEGVPPFPGEPLDSGSSGPAVAQWQEQMRTRGWDITADGRYGQQATVACRAFQRQKGLDPTGIVDEATWTASWTAPLPDNTET